MVDVIQMTWRTHKFSPGTLLGVTRGQTTCRTDKSFLDKALGITRGQDKCKKALATLWI